jgi:hypothetical protein
VNSFGVANSLLRAGVQGIITDNLALVEAMRDARGLDILDRSQRARLL